MINVWGIYFPLYAARQTIHNGRLMWFYNNYTVALNSVSWKKCFPWPNSNTLSLNHAKQKGNEREREGKRKGEKMRRRKWEREADTERKGGKENRKKKILKTLKCSINIGRSQGEKICKASTLKHRIWIWVQKRFRNC